MVNQGLDEFFVFIRPEKGAFVVGDELDLWLKPKRFVSSFNLELKEVILIDKSVNSLFNISFFNISSLSFL
jgi:hypothetical protein